MHQFGDRLARIATNKSGIGKILGDQEPLLKTGMMIGSGIPG
jgi:hypothetical protein